MASFATKLRQLTQLRCAVFESSYNPDSLRTGAKYLRARLRGPSMMRYYPQNIPIKLVKRLAWDMNIMNPDEEQRLEDVEALKRRGKGAPKKKKSKVVEVKRGGGGGGAAKKK